MLGSICFTLVIVAMGFPGLILLLFRGATSEAERREDAPLRHRNI
jgi:hypothetical protein